MSSPPSELEKLKRKTQNAYASKGNGYPRNIAYTPNLGFAMDHGILVWIARKGQPPLGNDLNMFRLFTHFKNYPKDKLTLVSNYQDFEPRDRDFLINVASYFKMNLIGFHELRDQIIALKVPDKEEQLELMDFAEQEKEDPDGCLALASDILRALSPVARCGHYRDHDYVTKARPVAHHSASEGVLIDADFTHNNEEVFAHDACNSVFACDESRSPLLRIYRAKILKNCKDVEAVYKTAIGPEAQERIRKAVMVGAGNAKKALEQARKIQALVGQAWGNIKRSNPNALAFRKELKKVCKSREHYDILHKELVLLISGPLCLQEKVIPAYYAEELGPKYKKSEARQFNAWKALSFQTNRFFKDESDCSWLPTHSTIEKTWAAIPKVKKAEFYRFMLDIKAIGQVYVTPCSAPVLTPEAEELRQYNSGFLPLFSSECQFVQPKAEELDALLPVRSRRVQQDSSYTGRQVFSSKCPKAKAEELETLLPLVAKEKPAPTLLFSGNSDSWDLAVERAGVSPNMVKLSTRMAP